MEPEKLWWKGLICEIDEFKSVVKGLGSDR